eukprot:6383388-Amphidinium_carterae.1
MQKRDRLQALIARTKCSKCGEKGHWARTCPQQSAQPRASSAMQSGQSRGGTFFLCGAEANANQGSFLQMSTRRVWKSGCSSLGEITIPSVFVHDDFAPEEIAINVFVHDDFAQEEITTQSVEDENLVQN